MIQKRAAFLVSAHQHTDPAKWYVGVYSDWDQKNEILRSPEDRDGLSAWLTDANDDAGNARPAFLASKNVFLPDQNEIESLELYISKYLWGGMQMTDTEKYPYAIYGIPNFRANRESADEGRNGRAHVWRIYDYPHIVMLYHRMYQIAKFYPDKVKHLDAATYLERAYRTAVAYWTVPMAVEKWSADAVGTMNEAFIPELIDTLEREGKSEWARTLRGHWEGKVDRFVNKTPNLYGSEFAFDSTGFESTGAFAKYAMTHALPPGAQVPADLPPTDFRRRVTPRGGAEVHELPAAAQHVRPRLARDDLLPARQRLSRQPDISPQLHVAAGRLVDPRLRAALREGSDRDPAPRLRVVAQFLGAREFRDRRKRIRLLVSR